VPSLARTTPVPSSRYAELKMFERWTLEFMNAL
jgi:hypothetical protein